MWRSQYIRASQTPPKALSFPRWKGHGQTSFLKDENGKTWYLLYNKGQLPGKINMNKVRDAGATTEHFAKQGKYLKKQLEQALNGKTMSNS